MAATDRYPSDIAFTSTVKAVQERKGSRATYGRIEEGRPWSTRLTPDLARFISEQTSVFLATANSAGQPYVQHRGGPPGFLQVLDETTIAFVDYAGNRQYITQGNLLENPKAHLFLIDYSQRRRVKIWGEAHVVEDDDELAAALMPGSCKARAEQVLIFTVSAWDVNCPQHIPRRYDAAEVDTAIEARDQRIRELEEELASYRGGGHGC